jgi:ADP-ribose pyrophosphatase YjhB (NUDIX family)
VSARPGLAAIAVVLRGGEALMVRRRNVPDTGLWGYPGGRVERGETVAACALRELAEETGVTAEAGPHLGLIEIVRGGHHHVLVDVACADPEGAPRAAGDADDAAWIPLAEIRAGRVPCSRHVAGLADLAAAAPGPAAMLLDD